MTKEFNLDFARQERRGYPEAIFCAGKTPQQIVDIARVWKERNSSASPATALFTRITPLQWKQLAEILPDAFYDETAHLAAWPADLPIPTGGKVLVVSAGTSDYPVAREASLTARYLGRQVEEIIDVGVAGLERILQRIPDLQQADVIIVCAGMDGALVPVVTGLVSCPVIALPTSVGYGASFGGLAALLSMLNSCAPGVGVVNIDNGYGAGHLAAQISAPRRQ